MTIKTTGAEWNRFYADKQYWPDDAWHEDEEMTVNGNPVESFEFDDNDAITITGGMVFMDVNDREGRSLESNFRKWRKAQNTVFLSVEAPREHADAIKAAIKEAGGKVA